MFEENPEMYTAYKDALLTGTCGLQALKCFPPEPVGMRMPEDLEARVPTMSAADLLRTPWVTTLDHDSEDDVGWKTSKLVEFPDMFTHYKYFDLPQTLMPYDRVPEYMAAVHADKLPNQLVGMPMPEDLKANLPTMSAADLLHNAWVVAFEGTHMSDIKMEHFTQYPSLLDGYKDVLLRSLLTFDKVEAYKADAEEADEELRHKAGAEDMASDGVVEEPKSPSRGLTEEREAPEDEQWSYGAQKQERVGEAKTTANICYCCALAEDVCKAKTTVCTWGFNGDGNASCKEKAGSHEGLVHNGGARPTRRPRPSGRRRRFGGCLR